MANATMEAVPALRRARPGIQRHNVQAPMDVLSGRATAPATSAQYPQPAQARRIDTATETAPARMSLTDTAEKRMARLSRATWRTEVLVMKIVTEIPRATCATRGSP